MKMKTTKFLAVLAVLAMAFAGFAAIAASEKDDATATYETKLGEFSIDYGTAAQVTIKGISTLSGKTTSGTTAISGVATNEKISSSAYSNERYAGYGSVIITFPTISVSGCVKIEQTTVLAEKGVLVAAGHQTIVGSKLTSTHQISAISGQDYELLIPQDGSKVTVTISFYSDSGCTTQIGTASTHVLDFAKTYTNITLTGTMSNQYTTTNVWSFTGSALTLTSFEGNVSFYSASALTVSFNGTNVLTGNSAAFTDGDTGAGASVILSGATLDVKAGSADSKLTVKQVGDKGFGIAAKGGKLTIGDTTTAKTVIDVSGGNRALYSNAAMDIKNSDVKASGYEKAISIWTKTADGKLDVDASTIVASISATGAYNGGKNDVFGIRVGAIDVDANSKITTSGLRVVADSIALAGIIYVKGDYEQNLAATDDAGTIIGIAGLYLDAFDNSPSAITAIERASAMGTTLNTIYLDNNAGAYTTVAIKDGTKTEVTTADADKVADELAKDANSGVTYKTAATGTAYSISGTPVVKDAQELTIITTGTSTVSGTITVGSTSGITLTLSDVKGTFMITKGSIHIEGDVAGGTLTIAGDTIVDGWVSGNVTIAAATGLTTVPSLDISDLEIVDGGVLNLNGVAVTSTKDIANSGVINLGEGTTFDSQMKIVNTATTGDYVAGQLSGSNVTLVAKTGTASASAAVTLGAALTVNGKLTIPVGTALAVDSQKLTIAEGGVVYVYGSITLGSGSVENNGTIVVLDKNASIPANISGTGTIDTSAISSDYNISGEYRSAAAFGIYQNVNIVGNTNMVKGSLMIINGTMNIAAGVTLTIEDGAMLVINNSYGKLNNLGTIDVRSDVLHTEKVIDAKTAADTFAAKIKTLTGYGDDVANSFDGGFIVYNATVENEGTIDLAWTTTGTAAKQTMLMRNNAIVNNEGLFNVSTLNTMTITSGKFNNLEDGIFNMEGTVGDLTVNNAGLVKLDGISTGTITIDQVADEASVIVSSIKGTLTVNDTGLKYPYTISNADNSITVTSTGYALSGLTFDSAVTYSSTKDEYYKNIYVNGKVSIDSSATASIALGSTDYVKVTDNLELPDEIALSGTLSVSGTMVLEDGSKYTGATLTVSGLVEAGKAQIIGTVNATYFVTGTADKVYHYTTLSKAVDMAVIAEVNKIYVVGKNSVTANVTIPSGMTVEQSGQLTIGSASKTSIIMEVEDGAKINSTAAIIVKATLLIDNKSTGITKSAAITSDIVVEDSTSIMYTNFVTAMGFEYDEPTTITLSNAVTITSNVTIPAYVTVDTNTKSFTVKGAKLTIDGTLFLNNSDYAVTDDTSGTVTKYGSVAVNGYIKSTNTTTYDGKAYPAGAYYVMIDKGAFNMVTSIANSPNVIDVAEDKSIRIFGSDLALGTLEYEGTLLEPAFISIEGTVASGIVDLEFAQLSILADKEISFTVTGADGSITFTGEKTSAKTVIAEYIDDEGDEILAMTAGAVIDGSVGTTHDITIVGGVVLADVSLNDTTVIGIVAATSNVVFTEDLVVVGVFGVNNASKVTANGDVYVLGSLVAAEVTETQAAGVMEIKKDLYVGGDDDQFDISATVVVSGDVSAANYYVFGDTTVDGEIAKYLETIVSKGYYTAFYVEGDLYVTIYSTAASTIKIAEYNETTKATDYLLIPADLEDCVFVAWQYDDLGEYKNIEATAGSPVYVGGAYKAVYASINYYIYKIEVYTDAGIKSVAIDGVEMFNDQNNKFVSLNNLEAGTHTISYTLKVGYQENKNGVNLYTSDGIILKDFKFVVDGDAGTTKLLLNGTEIIPEPEPEPTPTPEEKSEWTVTTILLCVLVVLIAIMAVIVALRLNRN